MSLRNIRITAFLLTVLVSLLPLWAKTQTPQEKYIERYAAIAVSEMYRSGVPASITLAQGLLESGYGMSELALKSNNHFGIKCHNNWKGDKVFYDDDAKGECFRKYDRPEDSFYDHSDFLRYRDRYKFLFDYKITDYKSWAYGLKKAGYATDPAYPKKLIRLIEEYRLHEYDRKPSSFAKPQKKRHVKEKEVKSVPESPLQMEQVNPLPEAEKEKYFLALSRPVYELNGVPFVYSVEGDTYESIAAGRNLFKREILRFNDLEEDSALVPGTKVYVLAKKNQAAKGVDKYVAEGGESLRDISQRYAVKLSRLCRMNGLPSGYVMREGDVIKLRK